MSAIFAQLRPYKPHIAISVTKSFTGMLDVEKYRSAAAGVIRLFLLGARFAVDGLPGR